MDKEKNSFTNRLEMYKILVEYYKNELHLYITRSNFFLVLQVGIIGLYGTDAITKKK